METKQRVKWNDTVIWEGEGWYKWNWHQDKWEKTDQETTNMLEGHGFCWPGRYEWLTNKNVQ